MSIEKFLQHEEESRRVLDREHLAPYKMQYPREKIEKDLIDLFGTAEHKEKYEGKDEAKIFSHLGKFLIKYEGIDRSIKFMDELLNNFRSLGYDAAFLVDSLKSSGLISEQFQWLGRLESTLGKAGAEQFEFTDDLELLPPIQDCNPQEKLRLYFAYLEGQTQCWNQKHSYELSKEK